MFRWLKKLLGTANVIYLGDDFPEALEKYLRGKEGEGVAEIEAAVEKWYEEDKPEGISNSKWLEFENRAQEFLLEGLESGELWYEEVCSEVWSYVVAVGRASGWNKTVVFERLLERADEKMKKLAAALAGDLENIEEELEDVAEAQEDL